MNFKNFKNFKPRRPRIRIDSETWDLIGELLIKIAGETIRDRVWRAIAIGLIAATTHYVGAGDGELVDPPPAAHVEK